LKSALFVEVKNGWKELIEGTSEDKYNHFSFDFWSTMAYSNPKFKNGRCELVAS
jgi:hypothetical protein